MGRSVSRAKMNLSLIDSGTGDEIGCTARDPGTLQFTPVTISECSFTFTRQNSWKYRVYGETAGKLNVSREAIFRRDICRRAEPGRKIASDSCQRPDMRLPTNLGMEWRTIPPFSGGIPQLFSLFEDVCKHDFHPGRYTF